MAIDMNIHWRKKLRECCIFPNISPLANSPTYKPGVDIDTTYTIYCVPSSRYFDPG